MPQLLLVPRVLLPSVENLVLTRALPLTGPPKAISVAEVMRRL